MSTQKRYPRAWRLSGTETAAPCGVEEATARRWLVVAGLVPAHVMNKRAMVSATPQHASREPHMGTVQPKMSLTRLYFLNHNPHSRHAEHMWHTLSSQFSRGDSSLCAKSREPAGALVDVAAL